MEGGIEKKKPASFKEFSKPQLNRIRVAKHFEASTGFELTKLPRKE